MLLLSGLFKPVRPQPTAEESLRPILAAEKSHKSSLSSSQFDTHNKRSPLIYSSTELRPVESEEPDLRDLNDCLEILVAVFPDVQIEVFREMLSSFDEESRLAVVTEALLKEKARWVRGRNRIPNSTGKMGVRRKGEKSLVPAEQRFRSTGYKAAVRTTAYHEFKGLPRSTINAVLAEFNHSYLHARPTLVTLTSKSWRYAFSSMLFRRKPVSHEAEHHSMVVSKPNTFGTVDVALKSTASPELDSELFSSLVQPLHERLTVERETKDHQLAIELNTQEAEELGELQDCECCYGSFTFEEVTACDDGGHFLCFQCVRHAVKEAVFGQNWQSSIDTEKGALRCLAPCSDECQGRISQTMIQRAFEGTEGGNDIVRKLDERLVEDSLLKTGLPIIRCPFCSYAEVDELYLPVSQRTWHFKGGCHLTIYSSLLSLLGAGMIPFVLPLFIVFLIIGLIFCGRLTLGAQASKEFNDSLARLRRKRHGLKFECKHPQCGRASCLSCSKGWTDIHICHESSILALRTQVEQAMSLAIKRICPRCNTSFVKSSGCNKLTCVCGYQMCYVCRKDIGSGEGYRHFCEHFRPNGGRGCTECTKCDLYRCEDEDETVSKAKEAAEREWLARESTGSEGDEHLRKVLQDRYENTGMWRIKLPKWNDFVDSCVDRVIDP